MRRLRIVEQQMPGARVVAIQGGIHDMAFQKPDEVARLTLEFLADSAIRAGSLSGDAKGID